MYTGVCGYSGLRQAGCLSEAFRETLFRRECANRLDTWGVLVHLMSWRRRPSIAKLRRSGEFHSMSGFNLSMTLNSSFHGRKCACILATLWFLSGCSAEVTNDTHVHYLLINRGSAEFLALRTSSYVKQGADWSSRKQLGSRVEYYSVPLDFQKPEAKVQPLFGLDNAVDEDYVVNPMSRHIETRSEPRKSVYSGREESKRFFPSHNTSIVWSKFASTAYAYADWDSRLLTYMPYEGGPCTIGLWSGANYGDFLKGIYGIVLSNDGRYVVLSQVIDGRRQIDVYQGCGKLTHHSLAAPPDSRLQGMCRINDDYWYLVDDRKTFDVAALKYGTDVARKISSGDARKTSGYMPDQTVIFDCEKENFYWTTESRETSKDHGVVVLHEFSPVAEQERFVKLFLGQPLY